MLWWITLALARPVPVQGTLTDAAGAPLQGTHAVGVRLQTSAAAGGALVDTTASLSFTDGAFAALIDVPDDAAALAAADLALVFTVAGVPSSAVPVAWAPRASYAAIAGDAETLGGLPRAGFIEETESLAARLAGQVVALGAGSTVGSVAVASTADVAGLTSTTSFQNAARSAVSGAAIDLAGGSTIGGSTVGALARTAVSGSAIDLNAGSTIGGSTVGALARTAVSGSAIDLNAASTLGGVGFGAAARTAVSGAPIDLAAGSTIGGQPFGTGAATGLSGGSTAIYASKSAGQTDGLVHWFPLDSATGSNNDAVNTATFTQYGSFPAPGVRGLAWDRGTAAENGFKLTLPTTYNSFTVSFWWRIDDPTYHAATDGAGILWASGATADSAVRAISYNGLPTYLALHWRGWASNPGSPSGARVLANQWVHYTLTVTNNTTSALYLNGVSVSTDSAYNWILGPDVWFGNYSRHGGNLNAHYSRGSLDEVAIWNRALTAAEVRSLHERQRNGAGLF